MRKMLRSVAKANMKRQGYRRVNRYMSRGRWREFVGAFPGYIGVKRPTRLQKELRYGRRTNRRGI